LQTKEICVFATVDKEQELMDLRFAECSKKFARQPLPLTFTDNVSLLIMLIRSNEVQKQLSDFISSCTYFSTVKLSALEVRL
jgi:hypothetical protein